MNNSRHDGFTLVEILVVLAIISLLAATLIPAVTAVRRSVNTAYLRNECAAFETAIEAYKLKYGDYPPDFSNVEVVDRHYRRIFPEILDTELLLLFRLCDNEQDDSDEQIDNVRGVYVPSIMDRGEALVWAVGGFSSDPQRPFTGQGGPLALIPFNGTGSKPAGYEFRPSNYQYNSSRDNALMDLDPSNLTIKLPESSALISAANRAESNDEAVLAAGRFPSARQRTNDLFPVYRYREGHAPYVYFDSRTYLAEGPNMVVDNPTVANSQRNGFATDTGESYNTVRPIMSDRVNTDSLSAFSGFEKSVRLWTFNNPKTFQVLSPGLDGVYGQIIDIESVPFYWQYPTGKVVQPTTSETTPDGVLNSVVDAYNLNSLNIANLDIRETFEKDNLSSFTSRSFEDDLP